MREQNNIIQMIPEKPLQGARFLRNKAWWDSRPFYKIIEFG